MKFCSLICSEILVSQIENICQTRKLYYWWPWDNWFSWFLCHICGIHINGIYVSRRYDIGNSIDNVTQLTGLVESYVISVWYIYSISMYHTTIMWYLSCYFHMAALGWYQRHSFCYSAHQTGSRIVERSQKLSWFYSFTSPPWSMWWSPRTSWWCHDREMFPTLLALCEGNPLSPRLRLAGPLWGESTVTKAVSHWPFVRGIHCHQGSVSLVLCEENPLSPKLCLTGPLWGESTVTKAPSHWSFVRGIHCHQSCVSLALCEGNPLSPRLRLTGPLWGESTFTKAVSHWSFVRGIHCHQSCVSLVLCEGNPLSPVDSPQKGPVTQNFDAFFVVSLNKMLNKLLSCQWFEIRSCSYDISAMFYSFGSLQEQSIIMIFRG